eukprot:1708630-Pyramimonas_sp.AAC.1
MSSQLHIKHGRGAAGRTPAPRHKKHRNEYSDLNASPLREGLYPTAVAPGDWQPSVPAVVEDDDMFDPPASLPELVEQDARGEALREVAEPPGSTHVRPGSSASSRGRPKIPRS